MANPTIYEFPNRKTLIWQESDMDVSEQAIVVHVNDSVVSLQQADHWVNLNAGTIPELIKILKSAHKAIRQ